MLWAIGTFGAWVWATNYEFTAYSGNEQSAVANQWPESTQLQRASDGPTLLFFVHPRCPCTRASVHELGRVLTGTGLPHEQQPKLIVIASVPKNASDEWTDTTTLRQASELPKSEIFWDIGGKESNRFAMVTSGAVCLYGRDGYLLFSGGVTASRGHEGDSVGGEVLRRCLTEGSLQPPKSTPVFGCRIHADVESIATGETS